MLYKTNLSVLWIAISQKSSLSNNEVSTVRRKSSTMQINESLPQIMLLSSRTESGIEDVMKRVKSIKVTPEFASLVNGVFGQEVQSHIYRGYAIVPTDSTNITIKSQVHCGNIPSNIQNNVKSVLY